MTEPTNIRDQFTADEWKLVSSAPMIAAVAMSMADKTGPLSVMRELTAAAQAFTGGAATGGDSKLVAALAGSLDNDALQEIKSEKGVSPQEFAFALRTRALDDLQKALALIEAKGSDADLAAYKKWTLAIAVQVMSATKSGSTLGFGGEKISANEEAFFEELKTVLGETSN